MSPFWMGVAAVIVASVLLLAWPARRPGSGRTRLVIAAAALLTPLLGFALYAQAGHPGMADRPLASRGDEVEAQRQMAAYRRTLDKLAATLTANPDDAAGWTTLGTGYGRLGALAEAGKAYARAHALRPEDATLAVMHAEMLMRAADDRITPAADTMLDAALTADPANQNARLLKGLAHAQAGHPTEARALWAPLLSELPASSPWREALADNLARLEQATGAR